MVLFLLNSCVFSFLNMQAQAQQKGQKIPFSWTRILFDVRMAVNYILVDHSTINYKYLTTLRLLKDSKDDTDDGRL